MDEGNEKKDSSIVKRSFYCKKCQKTHQIKLSKNLLKDREKFPFAHVCLHNCIKNGSEVKELVTIIYLDSELKVRHSEIQEFGDGNDSIFSKKQVINMISELTNENEILREELDNLTKRLNDLRNQN